MASSKAMQLTTGSELRRVQNSNVLDDKTIADMWQRNDLHIRGAFTLHH